MFVTELKAVLAESYEKIHKDHLIGIGIAPLQFLPGESADSLGLSGRETFFFNISEELSPGVTLNIKRYPKFLKYMIMYSTICLTESVCKLSNKQCL